MKFLENISQTKSRMRKRIGIIATVKSDGSMSISGAYMHLVNYFGQPIIIDALDEKLHDVDLLILPGGSDVDSLRYGEKPSYHAQQPNHFMEWFDNNMLGKYIEKKTPIFGICRGFQTLNVHFGGKMVQNIHQKSSNPRNELIDELVFDERYVPLAFKITKKYEVNSLHHQGFYAAELGKGLAIVATNKHYGNVEAVCHKELPIVAVQWHPEEIYDQYSMMAIKQLLNENNI